MDDYAHGDGTGPAQPKKAEPSEAKADTVQRETVADAIPTLEPHPPRSETQSPLWPEARDATIAPTPDVEPRVEPAPETAVAASYYARPDSLDVSIDDREPPTEPEAEEAPVLREPPPDEPPVEAVPDVIAPAELDPPGNDEPATSTEAEPELEIVAAPAHEPEEHPAPASSHQSEPDVFARLDVAAEAPAHEAPPVIAEDDLTVEARTHEPAPEIHEDQIWSGPDAREPSLRSPEPVAETEASPPAGVSHSLPEPERQPEPDATPPAAAEVPEPVPPPTPSLAIAPAAVFATAPAATLQSPDLTLPDRARSLLPTLRFVARVAGVIVVTLVALVLLLVVLYRWIDPPASTLMVGQRLTGTEIEHTWVPLDRISPNLVQAVLLSEDGAFCRHRGVDLSALEEAIESSRGGSTITMQVVKNLFLWPSRSYVRKALEIALAYLVEVVWSKERILEIYLNIAEWGPGVFGAEAASRHHFNKAASRLSAQEAALLAVSLPSPIERQAGYPGAQERRLADRLQTRMRSVRTVQRCLRPGRV